MSVAYRKRFGIDFRLLSRTKAAFADAIERLLDCSQRLADVLLLIVEGAFSSRMPLKIVKRRSQTFGIESTIASNNTTSGRCLVVEAIERLQFESKRRWIVAAAALIWIVGLNERIDSSGERSFSGSQLTLGLKLDGRVAQPALIRVVERDDTLVQRARRFLCCRRAALARDRRILFGLDAHRGEFAGASLKFAFYRLH